MKILPCKGHKCFGRPATASKGGIIHTMGSMRSGVHKYTCRSCGNRNTITSAEFNRLPEMTRDEIDHPSCDLTLPEEVA